MMLKRKARGTGASFQIASYQTVEKFSIGRMGKRPFVEGEDEADDDRHKDEAERDEHVSQEGAADDAIKGHRCARPWT